MMAIASVSMRRVAAAAAVPFAAAALSACFATRNDVALIQAEVRAAREETARADTLRAAQLAALAGQLRTISDSVRGASLRASRFEGDAREQLRSVREQLIQVQELTGQSQRRLQDLRASLEVRADEARPAPVPAGSASAPGDTMAEAPAPGPNELNRIAGEQLRRGSYGAARAGFQELLRRYPTADVAPDAQYALAEAYAGERNTAAADSAYAAVVTRYPSSSRAPTALYKRARIRQGAGRSTDARTLYNELLRRYPRSDEAALAREALRTLGGTR